MEVRSDHWTQAQLSSCAIEHADKTLTGGFEDRMESPLTQGKELTLQSFTGKEQKTEAARETMAAEHREAACLPR